MINTHRLSRRGAIFSSYLGLLKCCGHLLNGGHNKSLAGITQSPNQRSCAVGIVHAPILKGVVFVYGLVIEVLAVNKKEHLVDTAVIPAAKLLIYKRSASFRSQ